jgi:WD40 repeat protein
MRFKPAFSLLLVLLTFAFSFPPASQAGKEGTEKKPSPFHKLPESSNEINETKSDEKQEESFPWDDLPPELQLHVFSFLSSKEFAAIPCVSRAFHALSKDRSIQNRLEPFKPLFSTQPQYQMKLNGNTDSVALSPDRKKLAISVDETIKILKWNEEENKWQETYTLCGHSDSVTSIAWSPDGSYLASGSYGETIRVWNPKTEKVLRTLKGHTVRVTSIAWSPDGSYLASGSNRKMIWVWNPETGQELHTLRGHSDWVRSIAWSPDGSYLASGSADETIRVWEHNDEANTWKNLRTLKAHTGWVTSIAWSPKGRYLASGSGSLLGDHTVRIWNAETGQELHTLRGHTGSVTSIAWSDDGNLLASGSNDRTIRVWKFDNEFNIEKAQVLSGHALGVSSVVFRGDQLISGSFDGTLLFWNRIP